MHWRLLDAAGAVPECYGESMFLPRRAKFFWYVACWLPVAGFACSGLALRLPGACFTLVSLASVVAALLFASCCCFVAGFMRLLWACFALAWRLFCVGLATVLRWL